MSHLKLRALTIDTKKQEVRITGAESNLFDYNGNYCYSTYVATFFTEMLKQDGKDKVIKEVLYDIYVGGMQGGSTIYEKFVKYFGIAIESKDSVHMYAKAFTEITYIDGDKKEYTLEEFKDYLLSEFKKFKKRKKGKFVALYNGSPISKLTKRAFWVNGKPKTWTSKEEAMVRIHWMCSDRIANEITYKELK